MKKTIKKIVNGFGYDVIKLDTDEIKLYSDLYESESVIKKKFYNIGAGGFSHPAWTNVDYESEWYKKNRFDISYDLLSLKEIPIETNYAEIVYSSHTIEHITDEAAQNMFNESFRILKEGGIFRITAPNIDLDYRAYNNNDRNYFFWIDNYSISGEIHRTGLKKPMNEASIGEIFLAHFASSVSPLYINGPNERIDDNQVKTIFSEMEYESALNYCTSKCPIEIQKRNPGNHINWWNKNKLFKMFNKAGFDDIYLSGYGQSFSPVLRNLTYFDNTHPKISIYVEAKK